MLYNDLNVIRFFFFNRTGMFKFWILLLSPDSKIKRCNWILNLFPDIEGAAKWDHAKWDQSVNGITHNGIAHNGINQLMGSNLSRLTSPNLLFHILFYFEANLLIVISQLLEWISLSLYQRDPIKRLPLEKVKGVIWAIWVRKHGFLQLST